MSDTYETPNTHQGLTNSILRHGAEMKSRAIHCVECTFWILEGEPREQTVWGPAHPACAREAEILGGL